MILLKCCQTRAVEILLDQTMLSVDDLVDKMAKVLNYFGWALTFEPCLQRMWITLLSF